MKNFNEYINESIQIPTELKEFSKKVPSKPLPHRYVMMFDDEEINKELTVWFNCSTNEFSSNVKGLMFRGAENKTKYANDMANYVKLFMISKKFDNSEIMSKLHDCAMGIDTEWSKLPPIFLDEIVKSKLKLSHEEYEALGITKTVKLSRDFNI